MADGWHISFIPFGKMCLEKGAIMRALNSFFSSTYMPIILLISIASKLTTWHFTTQESSSPPRSVERKAKPRECDRIRIYIYAYIFRIQYITPSSKRVFTSSLLPKQQRLKTTRGLK
jgi:uncharacterized membrane protein